MSLLSLIFCRWYFEITCVASHKRYVPWDSINFSQCLCSLRIIASWVMWWSKFKTLNLCVGGKACHTEHVSQNTAGWTRFSPLVVFIPELNSGYQAWCRVSLSTEPSHWPWNVIIFQSIFFSTCINRNSLVMIFPPPLPPGFTVATQIDSF